eukprot:m.72970 g.72970  ORF g.72970 m.72970 type:complete len:642 (+) comp35822_c0_seq4:176-2101(+)
MTHHSIYSIVVVLSSATPSRYLMGDRRKPAENTLNGSAPGSPSDRKSDQAISENAIQARRLAGRLGDGGTAPSSNLMEKEGAALTVRLTAILWGILVLNRLSFYKLFHADQGMASEGPPVTVESFLLAQEEESKESDSFYQEIAIFSQHFLDQVSMAEKLELTLKKLDPEVEELKIRLETATGAGRDAINDTYEEVVQQLSLERSISRELSHQLREISHGNGQLLQQIEYAGLAQAKSLRLLQSLLDEFIGVCIVEEGSQLHPLFGAFHIKSNRFWDEMKLLPQAPVDKEARGDDSDEDGDQKEHSCDQKTNLKIIANQRKTREIEMKLEGLEEGLQSERAARELVETELRREIARLRRIVKDKDSVWSGCRLTITESMRTYVEHIETIGHGLLKEKVEKEKEIEELSQQVDGSRDLAQQLIRKVEWLKKEAAKEAANSVLTQLKKMKNENERLRKVVAKLGKNVEIKREESGRAKNENKVRVEEVILLRTENVNLKSSQAESSRKLVELERISAAFEARLEGRHFSVPLRSSDAGLLARHPGKLSKSSSSSRDPSLPFGGGRSKAGSAYSQDRPFDFDYGKSVVGGSFRVADSSADIHMESQTSSRPSQRFIQCLKCLARFPVSEMDEYDRHERKCYGFS